MENKALQQTPSKDLQIQLEQRKTEYIPLARTDEEKEFLNCFYLTPIKDASLSLVPKIVNEISELRLFAGAIKDVDAKQIQFEAQTVVKNYSFLTFEEVSLAFKLFTQDKLLPLDKILDYPNFSSLFISKILNSYIEYRFILLQELNNRKKPQLEYRPSAAEQAEDMRFMITEVHKLVTENHDQIILLNTVFNFLQRTGKLQLTQEDIEKGSRYADDKYIKAKASKSVRISDVMNGSYKSNNKNRILDEFTREYLIMQYFASKPLESILKEVTENDFK